MSNVTMKRNYDFKTFSFLLVYLYKVIFTIFFNRKWLGPRIFFLTVIRHVAKKNKALSQLPVKKSDKITPISGGIQAVRLQLVLICVKKSPGIWDLNCHGKKIWQKNLIKSENYSCVTQAENILLNQHACSIF